MKVMCKYCYKNKIISNCKDILLDLHVQLDILNFETFLILLDQSSDAHDQKFAFVIKMVILHLLNSVHLFYFAVC